MNGTCGFLLFVPLAAALAGAPAGEAAGAEAESAMEAPTPPTVPSAHRAPGVAPPAVLRGDKVQVTVWSGAVLLRFDAQAESTARPGETVIVRNPENGRRFVARVEEKGKVFIKK